MAGEEGDVRTITLEILDPPVGKQIVVRSKPFPGAFPTKKAKAYIEQVSAIARIAAGREQWAPPATDVPVTLTIRARVEMAKSWTKKRKAELYGSPCTGKPDLDNIVKAVVDGLVGRKTGRRSYEGIVLAEDDQVTALRAEKLWCLNDPRVTVTVTV